jgi:zinc protease
MTTIGKWLKFGLQFPRRPFGAFQTLLACLALGLIALVLPATAQEVRVHERVFAIPVPKATSIQFQMIVLAGSNDETDRSQQGIAHYLEHLILVGRDATNREGAMKFFADGSSNGSTSSSLTTYIHTFPADSGQTTERLNKLFAFYMERLKGISISEADAARELNVVRQERDWRYSGNPVTVVNEELRSFLYRGMPEEHSVIGTKESIASFTLDAAQAFHRKWYQLGNVYFLVTGPIDPALVKGIAETHLSGVAIGVAPQRPWRNDAHTVAPESSSRLVRDPKIANDIYSFTRLYPAPIGFELKTRATQMLVNMFLQSKIAGSPHSALAEGDDPVASAITSASMWHPTTKVATLSLGGVPEESKSREDMQKALDLWLASFVEKSIPDPVLERLKRRALNQIAKSREEPANTPGRLIGWLGAGLSYDELANWPKVIESVRPEDVRQFLDQFRAPSRQVILEQARG